MKKTIKLASFFLCMVLLCLPAFAQKTGIGSTETRNIRSLSLSVVHPVEGLSPAAVSAADLKIMGNSTTGLAVSEGSALKADVDYKVLDTVWTNTETGAVIDEFSMQNTFEVDKKYTVTVRFYFADASWEAAYEGFFGATINGKEVIPVRATLPDDGSLMKVEERQVYELSCFFVCASSVPVPDPHLVAEGEAKKIYDGTSVLLRLNLEKAEGVNYRIEWYRDETLIPEKTDEIMELFGVKDSGKYACKVYAYNEGATEESGVFSWTEEVLVEINPLPVTIQIGNTEKNVLDEDPEFVYTVMGEIFDALEGSPERVPGEELGEYAINGGTLAFPEESADNYVLQILPGTLKILQAGELPYFSVTPGDFSYIIGESGSKIMVQAAKGTLPDGSILKLDLPDSNAVAALEALTGKKVMKGFTVSMMADGKLVEMPNYGSLRIQIPLTADEAALLLSEPYAAFYNGKGVVLSTTRVENGSVAYLSIQIDDLGTVVIFGGEGEKAPVVEETGEAEPTPEEPKEQNSALLWVLAVMLTLLSVGGIVFTVIWTKKNSAPKPKPAPSAPSAPAARPAPRPAPTAPPATAAPVPPVAPKEEKKEVVNAPVDANDATRVIPAVKKKNVISFDDLED